MKTTSILMQSLLLFALGCDGGETPCRQFDREVKQCWSQVDCTKHSDPTGCASERMFVVAFESDCDSMAPTDISMCKQAQLVFKERFAERTEQYDRCDLTDEGQELIARCEAMTPATFCKCQ